MKLLDLFTGRQADRLARLEKATLLELRELELQRDQELRGLWQRREELRHPGPLEGADETDARLAELKRVEGRIEANQATQRVLDSALTEAMAKERVTAVARIVASFRKRPLREDLEAWRAAFAVAEAARATLRDRLAQLEEQDLQEALDFDPTEGLRPELLQVLDLQLPARLREVFNSGRSLSLRERRAEFEARSKGVGR